MSPQAMTNQMNIGKFQARNLIQFFNKMQKFIISKVKRFQIRCNTLQELTGITWFHVMHIKMRESRLNIQHLY